MFKPKSTSDQYRQRMHEVEELMDDIEHGEMSILKEMKKKELAKMDSVWLFEGHLSLYLLQCDESIPLMNL